MAKPKHAPRKAPVNAKSAAPAHVSSLRKAPTGPAADAFWSMIARIEAASGGDRTAACRSFRAELQALDDVALRERVNQFRDASSLSGFRF